MCRMQYLHHFGVKLSSEHWAKLLIGSYKSDQNKKSTRLTNKEPVILYSLKEEHSQEVN